MTFDEWYKKSIEVNSPYFTSLVGRELAELAYQAGYSQGSATGYDEGWKDAIEEDRI